MLYCPYQNMLLCEDLALFFCSIQLIKAFLKNTRKDYSMNSLKARNYMQNDGTVIMEENIS